MGSRYGHWWRHVRNIVAAYALSWLWVVMVLAIMRALLPQQATVDVQVPFLSVFYSLLQFSPPLQEAIAASAGLSLFMALVFAPFIEEALFRMFPLTLVGGLSRDRVRAVLIAVCCIIFGWAHGSPLNVFIQGFVGLMLGWLYLKNNTSQWASYISCVIVHAAYNFTVIMMGM